MTEKPYKRRILLIKKGLQYKFIFFLLVTVLVAVGVIALDMFTSLGRYLSEAGGDVAGIYANAKFALAVKVTIYTGGVALLALVLSNKVAGPVYRFEKSAGLVAEGDLTSLVHLRDGDELLDLRESFNVMVESLRGKVSSDVARAEEVRRLLEALLKDGALPPELSRKLREAADAAGAIGKSFRI